MIIVDGTEGERLQRVPWSPAYKRAEIQSTSLARKRVSVGDNGRWHEIFGRQKETTATTPTFKSSHPIRRRRWVAAAAAAPRLFLHRFFLEGGEMLVAISKNFDTMPPVSTVALIPQIYIWRQWATMSHHWHKSARLIGWMIGCQFLSASWSSVMPVLPFIFSQHFFPNIYAGFSATACIRLAPGSGVRDFCLTTAGWAEGKKP